MNTQEFIKRSKEMHGDRFDYSKSEFVASTEKIIVTCRVHGDFPVAPYSHMNGTGCARCSGKAKKTTELFVAEMKLLRPTFDYSNVVYVNTSTPVHVICDKGHSFFPTPNNHQRGFGCPVCYGHQKQDQEDFIAECKQVHGNKYDYSKVDYKGSQEYITVICTEHGEFEQLASCHKAGQGCSKCAGRNKITEDIIAEFVEVHGDKYDYSKVDYVGSKTDVTIVCREHGDFPQSPNSHLKGRGCPYCAGNTRLTTEEFIEKSKVVHGDLYDYSKTIYGQNNREGVIIICKEHGEFTQAPFDHLEGCGCPRCHNFGSTEQELRDYVESFGFNTIKDRTILEGKEIDVFVPDLNLGFEFNGLFWHSEKRTKQPETRHKHKTDLARSKGVKLIHIYEDDWEHKKDIVKAIIRNALGMSDRKLFARKCVVSTVTPKKANDFMEANHIQGRATGVSVSIGLFYDSMLVSVMQFSKNASNRGETEEGAYELVRFSSNVKVVGGASKLFSYFLKSYKPKEVTSYSDNDVFDGGTYELLGFNHVSDVPADYKIIDGHIRRHKSNYRKSMLAKRFPKDYDPALTEHENCLKLRLYRIYNSGLKKWLWSLDTTQTTN